MATVAEEKEDKILLTCQRIGCDARYYEDENVEGGCRFHPGAPLFHDGGKEWSCCRRKSHDFSLFLALPGCATDKHTTEKPVTKAAPSPNQPLPMGAMKGADLDAAKLACQRCSQGFFCSDHGAKPVAISGAKVPSTVVPVLPAAAAAAPPPPPKEVDVNEPQLCKNKGCGATFKEIDNHDTACSYHPGPAVFHDRSKGWGCCNVHEKEFDDFMKIPPCAKGWHNANAT